MRKSHYRILSWMLILALLLSAPVCGTTVMAEGARYGADILAQMDNAEALLYAYHRIVAGIDAAEAKIDLQHRTYRITGDELGTVFDMVFRDYPEYFWITGGWGGSTMGGYAISIAPGYHMTGDTLATARAALEQQVAALTADLEGKSDYEKSLLLHNRLAEATVYINRGYHQTAYGALVQGTAVCAGYSRAYQLLMQRVGIPAWYVTGTSVNPGTGLPENHGWNLVQLDGEWYYTDVTWDDQTNYTFYAYLNVTTARITEDHTFGEYASYLPAATATEHNYHVRNGLVMDEADDDELADVIRSHHPARICVTGDIEEFVKEYYNEIYDIAEELHIPNGFSFSYGYSRLGREIILRLVVNHTCQYETVTVPATCLEDGYTVEVCSYEFCHNEQNRSVINANGDHTYDHAYDTDCNVCGTGREVTTLVGDVDADGSLSIRDALALQQDVNGWTVFVYDPAEDINGDGHINNKDLVLLLRQLNGWEAP